MSAPPSGSTWMRDNLHWLKDFAIRDVLTIPGSHDAGMDRVVETTFHATKEHVQTQTRSIYGQLQLGARWFDLRPMLRRGSEWYSGHYTGEGATGWQGGIGEKIDDVIDDVNRFTAQNKELIVLRITHICNADNGDELSLDRQTELLRMFYDRLRHVRKTPVYEDALGQRLDHYVNTDQCVVVATRANADEGNRINDSVYGNIGTSIVDYWQDIVSCCYMQGQAAAIATSFLFQLLVGPFAAGSLGVLGGTAILQGRMFATLPQMLLAQTGGSSLRKKGVVLQLDNICDDASLNMCLAASRANWITGTAGNQGGHVIAVYGGKLIDDQQVLEGLRQRIVGHKVFKVENNLFGPDPWFGTRKSCCILYSENRSNREGNGLFWRGLFGREGDEIDFSYDISEIRWNDQCLTDDKYRQAYAALAVARYTGTPFRINLDKMDFLKPDPAVGQVKNLVIRYKSISAMLYKERNIYEHSEYNLQRDIDWLRYENWVVDEPRFYRQFFDRIDRRSDAGIMVSNSIFEGRDPAVGKQKKLTMSLRKGPGSDREEWQWEGKWWNVHNLL